MLWGFYFGVDVDGTEYVEWRIVRGSKTRNGEQDGQERAFNPRMYATKTEKCPVQLFKKYMNLRPQELCEDSSSLYMQEYSKPKYKFMVQKAAGGKGKIWYIHETNGSSCWFGWKERRPTIVVEKPCSHNLSNRTYHILI